MVKVHSGSTMVNSSRTAKDLVLRLFCRLPYQPAGGVQSAIGGASAEPRSRELYSFADLAHFAGGADSDLLLLCTTQNS